MKILLAITCIILGSMLTGVVPALAAWLIQSDGEVGIQLDKIQPLDVGQVAVRQGDLALPGLKIHLVAQLQNGNPVALRVVDVRLSELHADDPDCSGGLVGLIDQRFDDNDNLVIAPGKTDVSLGQLRLPDELPGACAGATLRGKAVVKAAYGS